MYVSRSHWYALAIAMLLFFLTAGSAMAADDTAEVSVEGTDYACRDPDGNVTACKGTAGPPSTTAQQQKGPELLSNTCLEMFPELGKGTASISSKDILNNPALCQAYKNLYNRFTGPGECTAGSGVTKLQAITGLNADFAMALDKMLQDPQMKGISITSAYRKNPCPSKDGKAAQTSNHMYGCAADLSISTSQCGAQCKWIAGEGGAEYGLQVRASYMNIGPNEYNHVEPGRSMANITTCREKGPGGGIVKGPGYFSAQWQSGTDPAQGKGPTQSQRPTQAQGSGLAEKSGYSSATYKGSSNSSSIFGGNSEFGKMMQMMMAMQLMQGMSQGFGGLFGNTSSGQPTTSATPASYTPYQQPVSPFVPTNTSSNSDIDALIASLNKSTTNPTSTSGTSGTAPPPTASSSGVGQIQIPPPSADTSGSFINPTSGVAPLTVKANFTSGTSCSDAFDLSWGDGYRASMAYMPPQNGSACSMLAKINDIEHVYTVPGTYTITLKQGPSLSSIRAATATVSATGSASGGDLPPPAVSGNASTTPSAFPFASFLSSIGRIIVQFGQNIANAISP